jgi:hypothetical protein
MTRPIWINRATSYTYGTIINLTHPDIVTYERDRFVWGYRKGFSAAAATVFAYAGLIRIWNSSRVRNYGRR